MSVLGLGLGCLGPWTVSPCAQRDTPRSRSNNEVKEKAGKVEFP